MAVRDVGDWIDAAVDSVLAQSLDDLELIVIDDGSTDDTLNRLAQVEDPRVVLRSATGSGGAAARNQGIAMARGEYLAFADGDDIVPTYAYERLVGQARSTGAEMVVGNYMTFTPSKAWTRQTNLPLYGAVRVGVTLASEPDFIRDRVCWNRVFKRASWNTLGLAFADSKRSNDIRVMTDAYCALAFDVIPDVVYGYRKRVGRSSMTSQRSAPDALAEHLAQELGCIEAIEAYGDDQVATKYFEGILGHDVWHHIRPVLARGGAADPAYAAARELTAVLLKHAPESSLKAINQTERLTYRFIIADRWEAAAIVAEESPERLRELLAAFGHEEFVTLCHQTAPHNNAALVRITRRAYLDDVVTDADHAIADADLVERLRAAKRMQEAGIPTKRFKAAELAVLAEPLDDVASVRARIQQIVEAAAEVTTVEQTAAPRRNLLARLARR